MVQVRIAVSRRLLAIGIAVALMSMLAPAASGQTTAGKLTTGTQGRSFLTPLSSRFVIRPADSDYPRDICRRQSALRCPPVLTYGGARGGLPTIDPALMGYLPHVRVTFVLERMDNEIVEGSGVSLDAIEPVFEVLTSSSAASVENGLYEFDSNLPAGQDEWFNDKVWLPAGGLVLYDALVFNACETFSSFPVEHSVSVVDMSANYGTWTAFHGVDASTLSSLGFYGFKYKLRVSINGGPAPDGGQYGEDISDIHFLGKVNVTCTGVNSLD